MPSPSEASDLLGSCRQGVRVWSRTSVGTSRSAGVPLFQTPAGRRASNARCVHLRGGSDATRTLVPRCCGGLRSEEHTSELQSQSNLVCRLLLEQKKQSPKLLYFTFE